MKLTVNISPEIAVVVSRGMATLAEMQTVYSLGDLYDMLEILAVDSYNERILQAR